MISQPLFVVAWVLIYSTLGLEVPFGFLSSGDLVSTAYYQGISAAFWEFNTSNFNNNSSPLRCASLTIRALNAQDYPTLEAITTSFPFAGLIGPTSDAIFAGLRLSNASIPIIGPMLTKTTINGASSLAIPVRASIADEALALFRFFRAGNEIELIAVMYEPEFVSDALAPLVASAATASGFNLVASVVVSNGSLVPTANGSISVFDSLLSQAAPFVPEGILILASSLTASKLIGVGQKHSVLKLAKFGVVSVRDPSDFLTSFNGNSTNVYLSQVIPPYDDVASTIATRFRSAMLQSSQGSSLSAVALEGYVVGRLISAWLGRRPICDRTVMSSMSSMQLVDVIFGCCCGLQIDELFAGPFLRDTCNQGLRQVWVLRGTGNGFVPLREETFSFAPSCSANATSNMGAKALVFGQSAAFSGPSGPNGPHLRAGLLAAFRQQNTLRGGIDGHRLHLISLDDGYSVLPGFLNTKAFVDHGAYGLIGYYGTGISNNVSVLAAQAKVAYFAPYTGSSTLRVTSNVSRYIINVRASYPDEVNGFAAFATKTLDFSLISIFYQNDPFGLQGITALVTALQAINLHILSNGSYPINTVDVGPGLDAIINNSRPFLPQAVLIWAANAPAAAFIKLAKTKLPSNTVYLCTSFVGEGFISQLPEEHDNVYVAQVVPTLTDDGSSYPIVQSYHSAMYAVNASYVPSMVSLETYINARVLINAVQRAHDEYDLDHPERLVDAVYSTSLFSIQGFSLGPYQTNCNQGMKNVWLSKVVGQAYQSMPNDTFSYGSTGQCMSAASSSLPFSYLVFGQSAALSGPTGASGVAIQSGILAAFDEINRAGGIFNHRLHLRSLDDGYNLSQAVQNTRDLFREKVFGLIGYFGTDISNNIIPLSSSRLLPFIAPVTGSMMVRDSKNQYVLNLRAAYVDEMNAIVHYAASVMGLTRFSIIYQNDDFGTEGLTAGIAALAAIGLQFLSNGNVSVGADPSLIIQRLYSREPFQVLIVWCSGTVAAQAIRAAKALEQFNVLYFCPSVVGDNFAMALNGSLQRVYLTQVLPSFMDTTDSFVAEYRSAISKRNAEPSALSFEGYASARFVIAILQRMKAENIRNASSFIDATYFNQYFNLESISAGPFVRGVCNHGLRKIWLVSDLSGAGFFTNVAGSTFDFSGHCTSDPSSLNQPLLFGFITPNSSRSEGRLTGLKSFFADSNSAVVAGTPTFHIRTLVLPIGAPGSALRPLLSSFTKSNDFMAFLIDIVDAGIIPQVFNETNSYQSLLVSIPGPSTPSIHSSFNTRRVFMGSSTRDEVFAVVRYISVGMRLSSIGLIVDKTIDSLAIGELRKAIMLALLDYKCQLVFEMQSYLNSSSEIDAVVSSASISAAQAIVLKASAGLVATIVRIKQNKPFLPIFVLSNLFDAQIVRSQIKMLGVSVDDVFFTENVPSPFSSAALSTHLRQSVSINSQSTNLAVTSSMMEGYLAGAFISQIVSFIQDDVVTADALPASLFSTSLFNLDVSLGPFKDSSCQLYTKEQNCECDIGSRSVFIHRLLQNETQPVEEVAEGRLYFGSCEITPAWTNVVNSESSSGIAFYIIIIIVAVIVAVVAGLFLVYVLLNKRRRRFLALKRAPKGQVTLV